MVVEASRPGRLREEEIWALGNLAEDTENTRGQGEASSHDPYQRHDGHVGNTKAPVLEQVADTAKNHRARFVVDQKPPHFEWDMAGKHVEKSNPDHNGQVADHDIDGVGLGRSPAIHRGSPRFPLALMAVHGALWVVDALVRA